MKNMFQLPLTYYDILEKRNDDFFFECINNELEYLKNFQIVENTVDAKFFGDYLTTFTTTFVEQSKDSLRNMGVYDESVIHRYVSDFMESSSEFNALIFQRTTDYLFALNFINCHKKTFYIQDNLVEHLAQTKLNAGAKLLELPFECCLFVLTSKMAIDAFYAFQENNLEIDYETPITVCATSINYKHGKKLMFHCWHAKNTQTTYSTVKRDVFIHDDWSIEQALHTDWDVISKQYGNDDEIPYKYIFGFGNTDSDELFYNEGLTFFRILINAVLYVASNDADIIERISPRNVKLPNIKSPLKMKKYKKRISRFSKLTYQSLGESLPPIVIDKVQCAQTTNGNNKEIKSIKRFIVRGHWRNQPCGINREENKLIWIKPYYKGPDLAELINKQYIVK